MIEELVQSLQAQELVRQGSVRFGDRELSYGTVCLNDDHPHVSGEELKVRRVLPGDRIDPVGIRGTKKLQDIFVDAKIDRNRRVAWPIVARVSDNAIVWVPQLALSRSISCAADASGAHCLNVQEIVEV
jgi:tRNA(Ile)-lysidine synthetase-like protein